MGVFVFPRGRLVAPSATTTKATPLPKPDPPSPIYWQDLVQCVRADGGWLCIHQQCLELCPVCIFLMDIRYRRVVSANAP